MNKIVSAFGVAPILLNASAVGAMVEYAVDPLRSTVTVSGVFEGVPLSEQTPGSLTIGYRGVLRGDLDNGMLALGGNNAGSLFQTVPQQPRSSPDDLGLAAYGLRGVTPNSGEVLMAISSIAFYLGTEFRPPLDIADGSFAPADVGFFVDGGSLLFSTAVVPLGGVDLHGKGAPNQATIPGTFTMTGEVETLIIPIATTFSLTALSPDDLTLSFSGQIVATRTVPEPTTAFLILCGLLALARRLRGDPH